MEILQSHTEVCSLVGLLSIRPQVTATHFEGRYTNLVLSRGFSTLAKQQDYFQGENAARYAAIDPHASEPPKSHTCTLDEIKRILMLLSEPATYSRAVSLTTKLCWTGVKTLAGSTAVIPRSGPEHFALSTFQLWDESSLRERVQSERGIEFNVTKLATCSVGIDLPDHI